MCIKVLTSPLKNTTPLLLAKPPLNLQIFQAPLFRHSLLYLFFVNSQPPPPQPPLQPQTPPPPPHLKVGFFKENPKYLSFSSLTPSYLLKVTRFLVKISQIEFLVITEKNNIVYTLFFPLNISDFSFFFCFFF